MSQFFEIHPDNPQKRLLAQAVAIIRKGGVIAYPTDSCYALGCLVGDKQAMDRIARIRKIDSKHNFTLVCRDLSEIATYARVDNQTYRTLKSLTPGPYTFILKATHEVPRRLQNAKRKTIGVRVPDNEEPENDPHEIRAELEHAVDLIIDGGQCGLEPTSVVNIDQDGAMSVLRSGRGDLSFLD